MIRPFTDRRDSLISHVVVLLALLVGGVVPAAAQNADGGEVVAIRTLELNDDVDSSQFDRFVQNRYNPGWEGIIPGMKVVVVKADRGEEKGAYALIFLFDSVRTRNAYFPQEGSEGTESFQAYIKKASELDTELMQYVETVGPYTDYVALR